MSTGKRYLLFVSDPMTENDRHALKVLSTASPAIRAHIEAFTVTPASRTSIPSAVATYGTPALHDRHPTDGGLFVAPVVYDVLANLVYTGQQMEAAQQAARQKVMTLASAIAPPDPSRRRPTPGPGLQQQQLQHQQQNQYQQAYSRVMHETNFTTDGPDQEQDYRTKQAAYDPRSMPGTSMPHSSQLQHTPSQLAGQQRPMSAPAPAHVPAHAPSQYQQYQKSPHASMPSSTSSPVLDGLETAGVRGGKEPAPSTQGPQSVSGAGMGVPGGTMGLSRFGMGLGTDIRDAGLQFAGVPNTTEASEYALDSSFGGQRTEYNVEKGVPPYLQGMQESLRGKNLQAEYKWDQGGKVTDDEVERQRNMRNAFDQSAKVRQRGAVEITPEVDKSDGSSGQAMRQLMAERSQQRLPGEGKLTHAPVKGMSDMASERRAALAAMQNLDGGPRGELSIGMSDRPEGKTAFKYNDMDALRPPIGASGYKPENFSDVSAGMYRMGDRHGIQAF